jgi:DNA-binding transcriptional regulator LsrR (DeoR family)
VRRDPEARKELAARAAQMYIAGQTLVQIAEQLEVSYGKAHALAKEGGARMRTRGGPRRT